MHDVLKHMVLLLRTSKKQRNQRTVGPVSAHLRPCSWPYFILDCFLGDILVKQKALWQVGLIFFPCKSGVLVFSL